MSTRRFSTTIAAAAFAVVTAACGGGTSPASSEDRAAIETLLVHHYAEPSCNDLTTRGRKAFGHPVDDEACAHDIASQHVKNVTVSKVKVSGDTATAVADGFTFRLVRVSGKWLIDGGA